MQCVKIPVPPFLVAVTVVPVYQASGVKWVCRWGGVSTRKWSALCRLYRARGDHLKVLFSPRLLSTVAFRLRSTRDDDGDEDGDVFTLL